MVWRECVCECAARPRGPAHSLLKTRCQITNNIVLSRWETFCVKYLAINTTSQGNSHKWLLVPLSSTYVWSENFRHSTLKNVKPEMVVRFRNCLVLYQFVPLQMLGTKEFKNFYIWYNAVCLDSLIGQIEVRWCFNLLFQIYPFCSYISFPPSFRYLFPHSLLSKTTFLKPFNWLRCLLPVTSQLPTMHRGKLKSINCLTSRPTRGITSLSNCPVLKSPLIPPCPWIPRFMNSQTRWSELMKVKRCRIQNGRIHRTPGKRKIFNSLVQ